MRFSQIVPYNFTAKDPEVVKREIKLIQELLEEESDSKCRQFHSTCDVSNYLASLLPGCLESLIQYALYLRRLSPAPSTDPEVDIYPLLDQLIKNDPMRKGRYEDVRKQLETSV